MPNPTKYQPDYSFLGGVQGDPALHGTKLDNEFAEIAISLGATIDGLTDLRRSDGKLKNDIVAFEALAPAVRAAIATGGGAGGSGSLLIKDIDGLPAALDAKADRTAVLALDDAVDALASSTAAALGEKADLVGGKVPTSQLPNTAVDAPAVVRTPITFGKTDTMQPTRLFAAPTATPDMQSDKLLRAATPFNSTTGNFTANGIELAAEGSAKNGPRTASLGLTVSAYKEGFGTGSAKAGEIDNIYLVLRQDGPRVNDQDTFGANRSDGCGILIDAAVYPGVGFVGRIEGNTSLLPTSGTGTTKAMAYQIGCMDTTTNSKATGFFTSAAKGDHAAGLFVYNAEANGGYFDNLIYCGNDQGQLFGVSRRGEVSLGRHTPGGTTISNAMHLVVQTNASLGVLNAGKTVQLLNLTQNGDLSAFGNVNGVAVNGSASMQAPFVSATARVRIAPGGMAGTPTNGFTRGDLFVGASGVLQFCDQTGATPKTVQLV